MRSFAAILLLVWAIPTTAQQADRPPGPQPGGPQAIPAVTRTVMQFTRLETEVAEALHRQDQAAVSRLLTDDFELRTAADPGTPIPRSNWIATALQRAPALVEVSQMAARILPESSSVAVVSFLSTPGSGKQAFVVDLWVRRDPDWKLAARYSAPCSAQPPAKPTGKE